ncbi:uncharacterized protein LOC8066434 [Sorghum bicolor]|uniref:DCD domain-containing protein n=1 Tax=Sorghum bicolor TaxID=4558 RepID=A0A194YRE3_SORBI|nr:uncharacterized protein LOC8066434 [Sorghum bicolor]KXG30762.1 hypothetical protein SORBI_3004G237700 [Sorghum bicolor]OQU85425.1 hypothetical protein SORBI_3004G237700 [Sorghum bicolor]|eukprot:XP_021315576.1 uncharacterized protein LOC8066434 [Sorghum bicolor]
MVKRLRRKGDASSAPPPKAAAPGSTKPNKFKKKGVKTDPEKLKGISEASASAQTPAPKPVKTSPAAAAAAGAETADDRVAQSKTEDRKMSRKETVKGREEKKGEGASDGVAQSKTEGEAKERATSRKEMMKGREEERVKREQKRRKTTGKEKEEQSGSGFIFMCSARTKPECYRNGVFGLPRGKMDVVEKIRPGAKLFLYDFDLKLMYGVYKADTRGGLDLVRHAFDGKFPAQVKFSVDMDCLPIPESSFKNAIKENYSSKGRFSQELNSKQVQRLLAMFKPIGLSHPAPQHIEEVRRSHIFEDIQKPSDYEERRRLQHIEERGAPINVHAHPLEDQYKITRSLNPPLLDEPRRGVVLDPYHMQEPQHVPLSYYHQVATRSPYHQPHMDIMHERTAAEATVRDPLLVRDHRALPGELAARSERVDELYRSYKLSTRAMDLNPGASYSYQTIYEHPTSVYGEGIQRPILTRVNGSSVPVSTRYSFAGPLGY